MKYSLLHFHHPVIKLNTFKFTSYVLFEIHILSDKSLKTLQLPLHLFKLTLSRW